MEKNGNGKQSRHFVEPPRDFLSEREVQVLRNQIRNNSLTVDHYIGVIDLLINKERCPKDANTLAGLRERLAIAIAENDTFRKVLWRHVKWVESQTSSEGGLDAASFLVCQIKSRKSALMAHLAMIPHH